MPKAGDTKTRTRLRCDECGNKFFHKDAYPEKCPHCGVEFEKDPGDVVALPAFLPQTSSTPDRVFRDMEAKSIQRAEAAAAMAGVPVSEMSHLKITDLRDNVQMGETYAKPVQTNLRGSFQAGGPEFAAGAASGAVTVNGQTIQGVYPRAGLNALAGIQRANGRGR